MYIYVPLFMFIVYIDQVSMTSIAKKLDDTSLSFDSVGRSSWNINTAAIREPLRTEETP